MSVIDFNGFLRGSAHDHKKTASAIDDAFRTKGFFLLRNHGIPKSTIEACFKQSEEFFKLPEFDKKKLKPKPRSFVQGYIGMQEEKIRGRGCMKENFDFPDPKNPSWGLWPAESQLPEFRRVAADFYQQCSGLIDQLLECLDLVLELDPADSLKQYHCGSLYSANFVHYPEVSAKLVRSGEITREPSHIDLSTLSLHFHSDIGGLQVADMSTTEEISSTAVSNSARFCDVQLEKDTILVNVGYLLTRWSNGTWRNLVHRVSIIETEVSDGQVPARYGIAFFGYPEEATIIKPLSCFSGAKFNTQLALQAGEYLLRKRNELYS